MKLPDPITMTPQARAVERFRLEGEVECLEWRVRAALQARRRDLLARLEIDLGWRRKRLAALVALNGTGVVSGRHSPAKRPPMANSATDCT